MTEGSEARRVAVVTGASGGIGRAVAVRLARDGMDVVVNFSGNQERADEVVGQVADAGGRAIAVAADVGDDAAVASLFDAAEAEFGGIDVLVHTAGIMLLAPLADLDVADFDRMQRVNTRGTFLVTREAARRVRPGGSIVNVSSSVTRLLAPTYSAYAATKAAVEVLTPILAKELHGRDLTVNAVAPGPVETPLFTSGKSPEEIAGLANAAPLGRLGQPGDIADVVALLAGSRARWINAQTIFVNGGIA